MNGHIHGRTWEAIHAFAIMYEIPSKYPKRITNSKIDPFFFFFFFFFDKKKRKIAHTHGRTRKAIHVVTVYYKCKSSVQKKNVPIYVKVLHNLSFS